MAGDEANSEPAPSQVACRGPNDFGSTYPCPSQPGFGGHIEVTSPGVAKVDSVELYRMGQTNVVGRYPFHLHLIGNRGSESYIADSSIHHSFFRAAVVHGTNNTKVSGNVAYDIVGHAYYLEDGVEEFNVFEYNLGAFIQFLGPSADPTSFYVQALPWFRSSADLVVPSDTAVSPFYIPNANNVYRGNAASGGWSGYSFPGFLKPVGSFSDRPIVPRHRPLRGFDGNSAHSTGFWFMSSGGVYIGGQFFQNSTGSY